VAKYECPDTLRSVAVRSYSFIPAPVNPISMDNPQCFCTNADGSVALVSTGSRWSVDLKAADNQ